jgi:predicted glycosyltransferase
VTPAVLFHVQHVLGIGHLQRARRIAEALVERGITVTLVSGGPPVELPVPAGVRFVQLEPIRTLDARFRPVDATGAPLGDSLRERRRSALLTAFATARPDAILIEGFPLARRAFRFELDPLIAAARSARLPVVCSLRDIVVLSDNRQRHAEIVERVHRDFAAVLVHGDPALVPLDASFPAAPAISDRLVYTGYVAPPAALDGQIADAEGGEVVVSAGGGATGRALLMAALAARRAGCLADRPWRLFAGTNLPEADFTILKSQASGDVTIERFRQDFTALLRGCRVSVSQAGYNTVLDVLTTGARAVLVPFAAGGETEQFLRAERLAALGVVEIVRESALSPAVLATAIEHAATRQPARISIDMDGAARSARFIAELINGGSPRWSATAARVC